jgi:hypothetical protein
VSLRSLCVGPLHTHTYRTTQHTHQHTHTRAQATPYHPNLSKSHSQIQFLVFYFRLSCLVLSVLIILFLSRMNAVILLLLAFIAYASATSAPSGQPSGQPSSSPSSQPSGSPTSAPTYHKESWGQVTWDKKRHRTGGLCENHCSNHGTCEFNNNCNCFTGLDGEPEWTGPDCSLRMCPRDFAWVGDVINANDLSPWSECSNKGSCDRTTGTCACFPGYEGVACQRTVCPNNCNDRGTCWPEKHLAAKVGRVYTAPWDAMKHVGCLCDAGYRGPDCSLQECPTGTDVLDGYGNEAGRDCSGRGLCNYNDGTCSCFSGFFGTRCQYQTTLF